MKKRMLSLLCVLALCLGLLPVTALAAAPDGQVIYVGNENVTSGGYWTTGNDGTVTAFTGDDTPADNYIHYNANDNILTLHNATIKKELEVHDDTLFYIAGAAIGVLNQSGDANLTITLEGTNTIKDVSAAIHVFALSGSASLTITGDGILSASSGFNPGIKVQSNTGNGTLAITGAKVTASSSSSGNGVQIRCGDSTNASLTVNGGSLTATGSGATVAGIIMQFGSSTSGSGTPTVTVSDNAIVRANGSAGGITSNSSAEVQTAAGTGESGGIVFDNGTGTVYGDVELQENLEIGEGESLTIPDGASLDTNGKTITVESGGKLEGEPTGSGTVKIAPTITTESLPGGTVGEPYTETILAATGDASITWSVSNGSLPAGLSLSEDGKITGTPTTAGTSTFTVEAENNAGSDSEEYTINIAAKSDTTPPTLTAGTVNRTSDKDATVTFNSNEAGTYFYNVVDSGASEPTDITSGTSYTLTSDTNTITLTNLTAGAKDIYIVAKDATGNQSATLKIEIPTYVEPVYSISADTTPLDFGSVYIGYTQPTAKTVTITNTGNQPLTLTQPGSTSSFDVGTLSTTSLPVNGTATFTVQPKAGLAVGTYSENISISDSGHVTLSIPVTFTVRQYSSGGGTPTKTPSQQAVDKIESAKDGSTVEIKLSTGSTKLDKEVFEELAGRDVTLEISLSNGVTWTVNGQDIPENADLTDLDLGVTLDASTIPVSVINTVTGAVDTIQISLKHDGEFGFTMILSAPLGKTNAGYWANLYYYNEDSRALEFQSADKIASDGTAEFAFSHASDYAIVIDTDSHEPVELPFTDVPEGAWYEDAAAYVYKHGLMAGTSATTFAPDVTTSRAMIATILWRMAGSPVVNYAMNYTDVTQGQWCSEAIRWATSEGVVTGYGNGLFGTNDPITREQLATMLWRYAQTEGYDVSIGEDTNILSYTDVADLSEYAIPAMQWAVGAGIINGTGDGSTLTPQGQATRAQAAVMLMRFCEEYVVW